MKQHPTIAIIGLGYVGLPLAVAFALKYRVVGFDINRTRIEALRSGHDTTLEISDSELKQRMASGPQASGPGLWVSHDAADLAPADVYIITVPTPIDEHKRPDLGPLERASKTVGGVLKQGNVVIYESTVYPGATEEVCIPILEKESGLKLNEGFFAGYSPERINPGDKAHTVEQILKVTSGSTPEAARYIDGLYRSIITAGTHLAPSIRVAEAAKVIENAQRDVNIAFVNELSKIFNRLGIDTLEVLEAAGTKWNFLPFRPGLVGGHCIGVDPYYLATKAQQVGYHPEIILAGRRMNDGMGQYVTSQVVKTLIRKGLSIVNARILVLGITFKENCPDIRNTRVIDIIHELQSYGCRVDVYDPWADRQEVVKEYGIDLLPELPNGSPATFDAVILTVPHREFHELDPRKLVTDGGVVYDVKSFWPAEKVDARL
jgi:UDP-N-acetyl-D-glucosamine/UDP-N-acetyl-D-galactosamine dehydrogenase